MDLDGKVAIVTGSTRGIGRGIAECFAREGARVVVNGRRQEDADGAATAIPGETLGIGADVGDSAQAEALVRRAVETWGRVDVLVNNAAIALDHFVTRVPDEEWHRVIATNLSGSFFTIRAAVPVMKDQGSGSIVNVLSYAGLKGTIGQSPYAASKGGQYGLTVALAKELAAFGIRVNGLSPAVVTDMAHQVPPERIEEAKLRIPLGRIGTAEEVAQAALFLASDRSSYTTGQVLHADGGLHLT